MEERRRTEISESPGVGSADREHWSRVAGEWIAWARKPNHDAFWAYRDSLEAFIGSGNGQALDVGCGEGRVSRLIKACGYRVAAVDPVPELVRAAREADSADAYAIAAASTLPFEDQAFDLVVAYNVLMDIENVPEAVQEMARVLRPDGTLVVSIVHPVEDIRFFEECSPEPPSERETYFGRRRFDNTAERDGLRMRFAGWAQPLEAYAKALESAGLGIVSLREPAADPRCGRDHMRRWSQLPLFLWLKARSIRP